MRDFVWNLAKEEEKRREEVRAGELRREEERRWGEEARSSWDP